MLRVRRVRLRTTRPRKYVLYATFPVAIVINNLSRLSAMSSNDGSAARHANAVGFRRADTVSGEHERNRGRRKQPPRGNRIAYKRANVVLSRTRSMI